MQSPLRPGGTVLANSAQAKKRIRQNERRRMANKSKRSAMRTAIKKVVSAIESKDKTAAADALQQAQPVIDGAVTKGLIHKNKAARHKSRLNAAVHAL